MDADFCAQFIKVMHLQGTPGFSTLQCYDKVSLSNLHDVQPTQRVLQLLSDHVKVVVFSCSEYEARNYGKQSPALILMLCLTRSTQVASCWAS